MADTPARVIPILSATLATPRENSRWTAGTYVNTAYDYNRPHPLSTYFLGDGIEGIDIDHTP